MDFARALRQNNQITIIRSSYPRHLDEALTKIKTLNPTARVSVLVMPRMAAALTGQPLIDELICLPTDMETYPALTTAEFTAQMRSRQIPILVILYNRSNQCGYQNVESLGRSFAPQQIWGCGSDGEFFQLNDLYLFKRSWKRFCWRLILAPLILPLILFLKFLARYTKWEER